MHPLRRFFLNNPALAAGLLVLALAMRLLVPAGFMPAVSDGRIVVSMCSGTGPQTTVITIPGLDHGQPGDNDHAKAEPPCAFAGLAAPFLGATDSVLLALAILFVMAAALRPVAWRIDPAHPFLRPPLRGPPARF